MQIFNHKRLKCVRTFWDTLFFMIIHLMTRAPAPKLLLRFTLASLLLCFCLVARGAVLFVRCLLTKCYQIFMGFS